MTISDLRTALELGEHIPDDVVLAVNTGTYASSASDYGWYQVHSLCGGCGVDCGCGGCKTPICQVCPERIATGEARGDRP